MKMATLSLVVQKAMTVAKVDFAGNAEHGRYSGLGVFLVETK
jgi:hypothetical protein